MYMNRILIKSDREYLREVFSRIDSGKYAVPSFQRDFVWKEKQVMELFDSILKGYPIGAITLWHSEDLFSRKDILTDQEYADKLFDYYILDGRQRLTALYGCCTGKNIKSDRRFSLSYNLIENSLVFAREDDAPWIVPICDIYDTFKMLRRMRRLQDSLLREDEVRACNEQLMQINTILQEYVISEILIEKCSLQEAGEVFARINSKGTEINQLEMLQAVASGSSTGILIGREVQKIKRRLESYGFGNLDEGTIMNCFYWFADLNFYENNAIDLARYNFEDNLVEITSCICRTAEFLHDECLVLTDKLLPYSRQFIALSSFFKGVMIPSEQQKNELKRWFYYTSACQSFMNGSLSNVRAIFNKFNSYIKGDCNEAGNYGTIKLQSGFNFRVSSKSALSDFLMLTQIHKRIQVSPKLRNVKSVSYHRLFTRPSGYFPLLTTDDKSILGRIMSNNDLIFEPDVLLCEFYLTDTMLDLYRAGDIDGFDRERTMALIKGEKDLLESCGFTVVTDSDTY